MSLFGRREAPAPDEGARQALGAAVASLREYQRRGIEEVPVADMLRVLGADPETGPALVAQFPDADPLTGCRSALPD